MLGSGSIIESPLFTSLLGCDDLREPEFTFDILGPSWEQRKVTTMARVTTRASEPFSRSHGEQAAGSAKTRSRKQLPGGAFVNIRSIRSHAALRMSQ